MRLRHGAWFAALLIPAALGAASVNGKSEVRRGELGAGAIAYRKCHACHALEPGRNLEGPSLSNIVGRRIAAERGFAYSPSLRALARQHGNWNAGLLDRYIADPEAVAPRTSMNFHGIKDRNERAALIAYLRRAGRR